MIKNLIFDFGKVLVDYDYLHVIEQFFDDRMEADEFLHIIMTQETGKIMDREEKPFGEIIKDLQAQYPRFSHALQLFDERYQEFVIGEIPDMRELLTQLKQWGFRLYGLTNWSSKVYETMQKYPIFGLLEGSIISSEEHLLKPEPAIYQRLFDKFHLNPAECLFTDDREENVEGGRRAGMEGIVFHNAVQYATELRDKLQKQ